MSFPEVSGSGDGEQGCIPTAISVSWKVANSPLAPTTLEEAARSENIRFPVRGHTYRPPALQPDRIGSRAPGVATTATRPHSLLSRRSSRCQADRPLQESHTSTSRSLVDTLTALQEGIQSNGFRSHAEVSQGVVKRVLHQLNWPVFDIRIVVPKLRLGPRHVEYALCHPARQPTVVLDVVEPGKADESPDGRILKYCSDHGISIAVLTDGRTWSFFYPATRDGCADLRFARLDLVNDGALECGDLFAKYLAYDDVRSGQAKTRAESCHTAVQNQKRAIARFPFVWRKLLAEPEPLLVDLFSEEVENDTGSPVDRGIAAAFLRSNAPPAPEALEGERPTPLAVDSPASQIPTADRFSISLYGETERFASGSEVLVAVFRKLSALDSDFCRRYATTYRGKKRRYVAKTKEALYPGQKILPSYCAKLPNGWWVATHCSNTDKLRRIRRACQIVGIDYGSDLVVHMHIGSRKPRTPHLKSRSPESKAIRVRVRDRSAK